MYLFAFSYQGEVHLASCNESSIESQKLDKNSQRFLEDLAIISIENYFKGWNIKKTNNIQNIRIYKIDSDFDEKSQPIHIISELKDFIPIQRL